MLYNLNPFLAECVLKQIDNINLLLYINGLPKDIHNWIEKRHLGAACIDLKNFRKPALDIPAQKDMIIV